MKSIGNLLARLETAGIRVSIQGDRLKVDYPQGALTQDIRQTLKDNKKVIIGLLNEETARSEPYITHYGDLCIPFNSDESFHWWNGGQPASKTKADLIKRHEIN